jgi:hypothetical protein
VPMVPMVSPVWGMPIFLLMEDPYDLWWTSLSLGSGIDDDDESIYNNRFSFDLCDDDSFLGFGEKLDFFAELESTPKRLKTNEDLEDHEANEDGDDLSWCELDEAVARTQGFANEFPVFWSRSRKAHVVLTSHVLQYATPLWLRKLCPEASDAELADFVKKDDWYSLLKADASGVFVADVGPSWGRSNDRHPMFRTNQSSNKSGRKPKAMLLTDALAWVCSEDRRKTYENRAKTLNESGKKKK